MPVTQNVRTPVLKWVSNHRICNKSLHWVKFSTFYFYHFCRFIRKNEPFVSNINGFMHFLAYSAAKRCNLNKIELLLYSLYHLLIDSIILLRYIHSINRFYSLLIPFLWLRRRSCERPSLNCRFKRPFHSPIDLNNSDRNFRNFSIIPKIWLKV